MVSDLSRAAHSRPSGPARDLHLGWAPHRVTKAPCIAGPCQAEPMPDVSRTPPGYHSVTPRVVVSDPNALVRFLRLVFDSSGDLHTDRPMEIQIGDSLVLVSSSMERSPFPAFLYVYVEDADRAYKRALEAGAESLESPRDTPYGDRRAMVRDEFGNVFQIAHRTASASGP